MTEGTLVVTWGNAVRGREHQALDVFGEVLAFLTERHKAGDIGSFEPIALEPSGGTLAGLLVVHGDPEKLARLRLRDDWLKLVNRSLHIVENFGVHTGWRGPALDRLYEDWVEQARHLTRTPASAPGYAPPPAPATPPAYTPL